MKIKLFIFLLLFMTIPIYAQNSWQITDTLYVDFLTSLDSSKIKLISGVIGKMDSATYAINSLDSTITFDSLYIGTVNGKKVLIRFGKQSISGVTILGDTTIAIGIAETINGKVSGNPVLMTLNHHSIGADTVLGIARILDEYGSTRNASGYIGRFQGHRIIVEKSAGKIDTIEVVLVEAIGGGLNIGLKALATGGTTNYAGYFGSASYVGDGNVFIEDTLTVLKKIIGRADTSTYADFADSARVSGSGGDSVGFADSSRISATAGFATSSGNAINATNSVYSDTALYLVPPELSVLTIRPNADGDSIGFPSKLGAGVDSNYKASDEIECDYNTTMVYGYSSGAPAEQYLDVYALENHVSESGAITQVKVYAITKHSDYLTSADYDSFAIAIKTGGTIHYGTISPDYGSYWATITYTMTVNPNSGAAWTWSAIDSLQAGVIARTNGSGSDYVGCSQIYVEVTYGGEYAGQEAVNIWLTDAAVFDTTFSILAEGASKDSHSVSVSKHARRGPMGTTRMLFTSGLLFTSTVAANNRMGVLVPWIPPTNFVSFDSVSMSYDSLATGADAHLIIYKNDSGNPPGDSDSLDVGSIANGMFNSWGYWEASSANIDSLNTWSMNSGRVMVFQYVVTVKSTASAILGRLRIVYNTE